MHEFVIGGTELGMPRETSEASSIDQRLRMLDAEADGKGFRLEIHASLLQHAQRVARTVPERKYDMAAA